MEGISPVDAAGGAEDLLHGADLAEYFGGENFDQASQVVISQLKYSTRHPNKNWTAARLAESGSRGQAGVIARLSQLFKAFADAETRDDVLSKLRIRLVSNQPCQPRLKKTLEQIAAHLAQPGSGRNLKPLLDALSDSGRKEITVLHSASKLPPQRFVDFLRLLDLSGLGAGTSWEQEVHIAEALGAQIIDGVDSGVNALYVLAKNHALPNRSDSFGLSAEAVLAHLGTSRRVMFPLPDRVEVPKAPLETPDARGLVALVEKEAGWIVAHGDAGVGKTTTLFTLEDQLPAGSVVVAYDCFGGGQSIGSPKNMTGSQTRHNPKDAVMEIVNELALRCGTPFLLRPSVDLPPMWRHLDDALREAGQTVSEAGGRLVIAVDAVDNAVIAARRRGEPSFVPDLLRVEPPDGVTMLISVRTHRLDELDLPDEAAQFELEGFDEATSAENLRRRFSCADDATAARFHKRSNGNPRSQFYLLDEAKEDAPSSAEQAAEQAVKSPKKYFRDLLDATVEDVAEPAKSRRRLALLISLPRPAEISDLAAVNGIDVKAAATFCRGLIPGLQISEGRVEFRDEDFESFLEEQVDADGVRVAHGLIADHFLSRKEDDPEAAMQVARHLALAGRDAELIKLCLEDGPPEVIEDPVTRVQTYFSRLESAMRIAESSAHRPDAIRLVVLAAKAAKTDRAVEGIVRQRPDLAIRFGEREPVERIYEDTGSEPWLGPIHLKLAALAAESGDAESAFEHLRSGEAWVQRWLSLDQARRLAWDLEADDLAAGLHAIYVFVGPAMALEWILRWSPQWFMLEVVASLFERLAVSISPVKLANDLASMNLNPLIEARALSALFTAGKSVPETAVRRVASGFLQGDLPEERDRHERTKHWPTEFTELAARTTRDSDLVGRLLDKFAPPLPSIPPFQHHLGEWDQVLRNQGLRVTVEDREADLEDLLPDHLKKDVPEPDDFHEREDLERDRRRYRESVGRALPTYALRARALLRRPRVGSLRPQIEATLTAYLDPVDRRWYETDFTYERWADLCSQAIAFCRDDGSDLITSITDAAQKVAPGMAIETRLSVGAMLLLHERYRGLALSMLESVAKASRESDEPAGEKSDRLLSLSAAVAAHDSALAGDYYRAAIEAAEGLDDDGAALLALEARLAKQTKGHSDTDGPELAERLTSAVVEYRPFVSEAGRLPWTEAAVGAAILNPPSAIALLSRWDIEGHLSLAESAPEIAPAIVEQNFLSSEIGVSLLRLAGEDARVAEGAIRILETARKRGAPGRGELGRSLAALSGFVTRDLLPFARLRDAPVVGDWLAETKLTGLPGGKQLMDLAKFARSFQERRNAESDPYATSRDSTSIRDMLKAGAGDKAADLAARLGELNDHYGGRKEIESYLREVGFRLAPAERTVALQVLADLPTATGVWRDSAETLIAVIHAWLTEWQSSSTVRAWTTENLPGLLEDRAALIFRYEEVADAALPFLMSMPQLDDPAGLLIRALGPRLDELRPLQLYSLAAGLALPQKVDDLKATLEWCLDLHQEPPSDKPDLPDDAEPCLAHLFAALFGHPDRRVRWRAAYAARETLIALGPEMGASLERALHGKSAGSFGASDGDFLWLSAELWGYMTFARVAGDAPSTLTGLSDNFAARALCERWPHASIREFARRAVLRLDESGTESLKADTKKSLLELNQARSYRRDRSRGPSTGQSRDPGSQRRFDFNAMDTLPYWYEPLAGLFATDTQRVVNEAERWIVDKLYFTDEIVESAEKARWNDYQYEEIANDHGSIPRFETLRSYLEYHGMLLAAGNWIDDPAKSIFRGKWDDDDPWRGWLDRHLDGSESHWGGDTRSAAPLRPDSYGDLGSAESWRKRDPAEYETELQLRDGWVTVRSYREFSGEDRYGDASVSSALVNPQSATALISALQSCKDSRLYQLPSAEGGWRSDAEIDEPGFRLLGWIVDREHPETGLTEHDPLSRSISFYKPDSSAITAMGLRASASSREWLNTEDEVVARSISWSDRPPTPARGQSESRSHSAGVRLEVRLPELVEFIRSQRMDLVIDVLLARQYAERMHREEGEEERYESGKSRVFVLRQNGEIDSLA